MNYGKVLRLSADHQSIITGVIKLCTYFTPTDPSETGPVSVDLLTDAIFAEQETIVPAMIEVDNTSLFSGNRGSVHFLQKMQCREAIFTPALVYL